MNGCLSTTLSINFLSVNYINHSIRNVWSVKVSHRLNLFLDVLWLSFFGSKMSNWQSSQDEDDVATLKNYQNDLFKIMDSNNLQTIKDYLESIEDHLDKIINAEDDFKQTPLGLAIKSQKLEIMKLILSKGAEHGDAMLIAVDYGFIPGIKLLHSADRALVNLAVLSSHFAFGTTPMMVACHRNSYELIELLFSLQYPLHVQL